MYKLLITSIFLSLNWFFFSPLATGGGIIGTSWLDTNENGIFDEGEPGQLAEVHLIRYDDSLVLVTMTNTEGEYSFTGLEVGSYRLVFLPVGEVIPTYGDDSFRFPPARASRINTYQAPFDILNRYIANTTRTINVGWIPGVSCSEGSLETEFMGSCYLTLPPDPDGIRTTVSPANPDYTYLWSDGQTVPNALFTEDQQYAVSITTPSGCVLVDRGYFTYNDDEPDIIELPLLLIPCGEESVPFRLPDSILNSGYQLVNFTGPSLLGLTVDSLLGDVAISQPGTLRVHLENFSTGCGMAVEMVVGKPVLTSELYLAVDSFGTVGCEPGYYIRVRGGAFDAFRGEIPPGHEVLYFDPEGEPIWYEYPIPYPSFYELQRQPAGTYGALVASVCGPDRYLTVTTPNVNVCRSVSGRLVLDQSGGCSAEGALSVPETMIAFTSTTSDEEFYAFTGNAGEWSADIPEDTYTVRPVTPSELAATYCDIGEVVVSTNPISGLDLVLAQQAVCPLLTADVAIPWLRREFRNTSYITYRNAGTGVAEGAQLQVQLDPFMEQVSAGFPFTRDGDTYTFELGDLSPFSGGRIYLRYHLSGASLGQYHCIRSKVMSGNQCTSPTEWEGAIVRTDVASCDGDQLAFSVTNIGDAVTTVDVSYYVLRNGELYTPSTSLGVLSSGDNRIIEVPANGDTYQIFTNQEPNAPAATEPSAIAEGCGRDAEGNFAIGFAGLYPVGNGLADEAIGCRANTGSYDPNEKLGYPVGVGDEKDVEPGTEITYDVYFQNTGTDTAFFVVIRDTLPEALDLSTLRLGTSSHNYVASIDTNRVLTFRFDDILLPDSTTNLIESQGVVQFRIGHDEALIRGDRFENKAAIYFDYNDPIITNYSRHRIAPERLINPLPVIAEIGRVVNASCGLDNGEIVVSVLQGVPPYSYVWSHDENLVDSIASGLGGGEYSFTITDGNGIETVFQKGIIAHPAVSVSPATEVIGATCGDDNGRINLSTTGGMEPFTYEWAHDASLEGDQLDQLAAGTYEVVITDAMGCLDTASFGVVATPAPKLYVQSFEDEACATSLGSASIIVVNFSGEPDLGISGEGIEFSYEALGGDSTRVIATGLTAGTYEPRVTDENGCIAEVTLAIERQPDFQINVLQREDVACNGNADGLLRVGVDDASGQFTYLWDTATGSQVGAIASGLVAGSYTVTVTSERGCERELEVDVTEPDALEAVVSERSLPSCWGGIDGQIGVTSIGGMGPYSYRWRGDSLPGLPVQMGLPAGTYEVFVTDANRCTTELVETLMQPEALTSMVVTLPASCSQLADGSISISVQGGTGPYIYSWAGLPEETGPLADSLSAGEYMIEVRDTNGCENEIIVTIGSEGEAEVIEVVEIQEVSCAGGNDGRITVSTESGETGITYVWSDGQTGPVADNLAGGQDYVVVSTNAAGCLNRRVISLMEGLGLEIREVPKDTIICEGDSYGLDLSNYASNTVAGPGDYTSQEPFHQLVDPGNYTVMVIDDSGCRGTVVMDLAITDSSFMADVVLAEDAVITLPYEVLETSAPEPEEVEWLYDTDRVSLTEEADRQYVFSFSEAGDYELSLVAYLGGCADSLTRTVTIHADSSTITGTRWEEAVEVGLKVSPNPSNGQFTVWANLPLLMKARISLFDGAGRQVVNRELGRAREIEEAFDLELPAGTYLVRLTGDGQRWGVMLVVR
jgi:uncharacterized repeat protein (TIGR01451 family)